MYPKPAPIKRPEIGWIIQRRKGLSTPFGFSLIMCVILTLFINDLERKETVEEAQLPPLAQATEQECLYRQPFKNNITFHKAYPCFCSTSRDRTNRSHHSYLFCCPLNLQQRSCPFYLQQRTQQSIFAPRERSCIWYFWYFGTRNNKYLSAAAKLSTFRIWHLPCSPTQKLKVCDWTINPDTGRSLSEEGQGQCQEAQNTTGCDWPWFLQRSWLCLHTKGTRGCINGNVSWADWLRVQIFIPESARPAWGEWTQGSAPHRGIKPKQPTKEFWKQQQASAGFSFPRDWGIPQWVYTETVSILYRSAVGIPLLLWLNCALSLLCFVS